MPKSLLGTFPSLVHRSMVYLAYKDLLVGFLVQEHFAVHFIDALSDKDDRLYLRREKPETLDKVLSLAREQKSLRFLGSNDLFRQTGGKIRATETERTQLQMQVDELGDRIDYQQQQLQTHQNIID